MNVKIGAKLKALRARDGVTQEKLACALGVTAQAVSKWESENGYPDLEYLTPIANFFNVTLDELFGHDLAEKQRKIDAYCAQYDEWSRHWSSPEEQVDLMRRALAEFPANEKLLFRLATALWYQWDHDVRACDGIGRRVNGKYARDHSRVKSIKGWQEPRNIMEELLASSTDDAIRYECAQLLIFMYSNLGEKERAVELADHYPDDAVLYSQRLIVDGLTELTLHLPQHAKDRETRRQAIEKLLDLYNFIFSGQYGFYNVRMYGLCETCAEILLQDDRIDEAFAMLEKAFAHAKAFDLYLDQLRSRGEVGYSSPFTDRLKDDSSRVCAVKCLPPFLDDVLKNKDDIVYQKLHDDPRYRDLVSRAEKEPAADPPRG